MDVERVVHHALEPAVLDRNRSAAVRKVCGIDGVRAVFAAVARIAPAAAKGHILALLREDAHAESVAEHEILEHGVLRPVEADDRMRTVSVAHYVDVANLCPRADLGQIDVDQEIAVCAGAALPAEDDVCGTLDHLVRIAVEYVAVPQFHPPVLAAEHDLPIFDNHLVA